MQVTTIQIEKTYIMIKYKANLTTDLNPMTIASWGDKFKTKVETNHGKFNGNHDYHRVTLNKGLKKSKTTIEVWYHVL